MGLSLHPRIWDGDCASFQTFDRATSVYTVNPVGIVHHYLCHSNGLGPAVHELDFHDPVFRQPNTLDRELLHGRKALTKDPNRADFQEYRDQGCEQYERREPLEPQGQT
jgi:hypothetical protein